MAPAFPGIHRRITVMAIPMAKSVLLRAGTATSAVGWAKARQYTHLSNCATHAVPTISLWSALVWRGDSPATRPCEPATIPRIVTKQLRRRTSFRDERPAITRRTVLASAKPQASAPRARGRPRWRRARKTFAGARPLAWRRAAARRRPPREKATSLHADAHRRAIARILWSKDIQSRHSHSRHRQPIKWEDLHDICLADGIPMAAGPLRRHRADTRSHLVDRLG